MTAEEKKKQLLAQAGKIVQAAQSSGSSVINKAAQSAVSSVTGKANKDEPSISTGGEGTNVGNGALTTYPAQDVGNGKLTTATAPSSGKNSSMNQLISRLTSAGMIGNKTTGTVGGSSTAAGTTSTGSYRGTYTDAYGNKHDCYIIGSNAYTDAAGRNPVPVGSYYTTSDGRVFNQQAAGADLMWSPFDSDYAAYDNKAAVNASGDFTVPGIQQGYSGNVGYEPRSGRYTVYSVNDATDTHNSLGYFDSAGNFHVNGGGNLSASSQKIVDAAKQYLAGKGVQFNGSGVNTIADNYKGIYATGDAYLNDIYNHNNLMRDYWNDLQGGGNGADVLANYGYAYDDKGVAHYVGGGTGGTAAAGQKGGATGAGAYNPQTGYAANPQTGYGTTGYGTTGYGTTGYGANPQYSAANVNGNTVNLAAGRPTYDPMYQDNIDDLLGQISGYGPYQSQYAQQISDALNGINNYGPYQSEYADRIAAALDRVENYGPYQSQYGQQLQDAIAGINNYGPYQSEYADQIAEALAAIQNRDPFSYDPATDPAYQAYKKQYTREGRRASEDVMGQYAAMTGGTPSTAAMTAAGQANNYYNAQMTDKIPELYRLAYDMYLNEGSQMQQNLNNLRGLDQDAYGRYGDTYNRMLQAYDVLRSADSDAYGRYADDYSRQINALNALNQQDQIAYGRYGDEYNRMLNNLDALNQQDQIAYGRYGDQYDQLMNGLNAYRTLENDNYGRYRDTVGDWENDRNFDYGAYQDQLNWDYKNRAYADSRADTAWEQAYKERSYQDSRADTDWEKQWNEAELAARYGDYSKLGNLGINYDSGNQLYAYSSDGSEPYTIGSTKGKAFIESAPAGATMTGGDGSYWVKSPDGATVTITRLGKTWTIDTGVMPATGGGGYWGGSWSGVGGEENGNGGDKGGNGTTYTGGYGDARDLSQMATDLLKNIQKNPDGSRGRESALNNLYRAVESGMVSDEELEIIMDLLGVYE